MYTNSYPAEPDMIAFDLAREHPRVKGVLVRKFKVDSGVILRYSGCLVCGWKYVGKEHHHFFRTNSIPKGGLG